MSAAPVKGGKGRRGAKILAIHKAKYALTNEPLSAPPVFRHRGILFFCVKMYTYFPMAAIDLRYNGLILAY